MSKIRRNVSMSCGHFCPLFVYSSYVEDSMTRHDRSADYSTDYITEDRGGQQAAGSRGQTVTWARGGQEAMAG